MLVTNRRDGHATSARSRTGSTGSTRRCRSRASNSRSTNICCSPTSRCCSTPACAGSSRTSATRSPTVDAGRETAARLVQPCRGGRMRVAQPLARGGAASRALVRRARGDGLGRRHRPTARRAPLADGEVRRSRRPAGALDRRAARAAWLGDAAISTRRSTGTLFCGDLFTQPGIGEIAADRKRHPHARARNSASRSDLLLRTGRTPQATLARIAATEPETLACMHGSAWRGDGGGLIRALATALA